MMKKKIAALLVLTIAVTLSACGKRDALQQNPETVQEKTTWENMETVQKETIPESTESPEETQENALQLPILDEIDQNTLVGTAGSSLTAVQSAVKLLDWGIATGLDPEEIKAATVEWLSDKGNDEQAAFAEKLESVDYAYQKLLGDEDRKSVV